MKLLIKRKSGAIFKKHFITRIYKKILEEFTIVRKYVELLSSQHMEEMTFTQIDAQVIEIKKNSLLYIRQKKENAEKIVELTKDKGIIKQQILKTGSVFFSLIFAQNSLLCMVQRAPNFLKLLAFLISAPLDVRFFFLVIGAFLRCC